MASEGKRRSLLSLSVAFAFLSACAPASASAFTTVIPDSSTTAEVPPPVGPPHRRPRTDPDEQRAVYEVMAATGNGWAVSVPDVCREGWHGIECAPDAAGVLHVVSLSFGTLSDDAGFPPCDQRRSFLSPALARLPHLRGLFFYRCLAGNPRPTPVFLGGLGASLRTLVLRENGLIGAVPAELGNLTSLRVLDLHGNNLSSSIPSSVSALTHLQLLDLSDNQLTGVIPHFKLPSLRVIDLSNNQLEGKIPPSLGGCDSLIKLDLSRNFLNGEIPASLGDLRDLILLDLSRNRLAGPLPGSLRRLTSLRSLILSGNDMGAAATIPDGAFAGMKDLTTLALSDMGLRGPIPESVGGITSLRVLHLGGNHLNGSIPRSFRNLVQLSELSLNNNQLTGPLPFARQVMWRMGRKLSVSNNSGLCYDAVSDAVSAPYLPGIGLCGEQKTGTAAAAAVSPTAVRTTADAATSVVGPGGGLVRYPVTPSVHSLHFYSSSSASTGERSRLLRLLFLAVGILSGRLAGPPAWW